MTTTPATGAGPYRAARVHGFSLLRVEGPTSTPRVFTRLDDASVYAEDLNKAFSAGRAAADADVAELVKACRALIYAADDVPICDQWEDPHGECEITKEERTAESRAGLAAAVVAARAALAKHGANR